MFFPCVCQCPSFGPDINKRVSVFLRHLADRLDQEDKELRSTDMKRDFISNRLPPYLLDQADLEPGESHVLRLLFIIVLPTSCINIFLFQLENCQH